MSIYYHAYNHDYKHVYYLPISLHTPFVILPFHPFPSFSRQALDAYLSLRISLHSLELVNRFTQHVTKALFLSNSFLSITLLRFFHTAKLFYGLFFSLLQHIPLYGYTTICLCIQLLMDIWVVSTFFWLLQLKLL